jgi:hypothetical protein
MGWNPDLESPARARLRLMAFVLVAALATFAVWRVEQEAQRRTRAIAVESMQRERALRAETEERIYENCVARQATRAVLRDLIVYVVASAQPSDIGAEHLRVYIEGANPLLDPQQCQKGNP